MKTEIAHLFHRHFESYVHHTEGVEFWYARDLQELQDNKDWQNYLNVIEKARGSCQTAKHEISDHFVGVNNMVPRGLGWYAPFSRTGIQAAAGLPIASDTAGNRIPAIADAWVKISGYRTTVRGGV